jgi:hypothetical protein
MDMLMFVCALGAGVLVATKGGRGMARRALGWSARRAGALSAQATEAIGEARRIAREEFARERDGHAPISASTQGAAKTGLNGGRGASWE